MFYLRRFTNEQSLEFGSMDTYQSLSTFLVKISFRNLPRSWLLKHSAFLGLVKIFRHFVFYLRRFTNEQSLEFESMDTYQSLSTFLVKISVPEDLSTVQSWMTSFHHHLTPSWNPPPKSRIPEWPHRLLTNAAPTRNWATKIKAIQRRASKKFIRNQSQFDVT